MSQEEPGRARKSQEEPGGGRGLRPRTPFLSSSTNLGLSGAACGYLGLSVASWSHLGHLGPSGLFAAMLGNPGHFQGSFLTFVFPVNV